MASNHLLHLPVESKPNESIQVHASWYLKSTVYGLPANGYSAQEVVAELEPALNTSVVAVKLRAVELLAFLAARDGLIYGNAIIDMLDDDSLQVRAQAAKGLVEFLPTSEQATRLEPLAKWAADTYPHKPYQNDRFSSSHGFDPGFEVTDELKVEYLLKAIVPGTKRIIISSHLDRFKYKTPAVAALVSKLQDEDTEVGMVALRGLQHLGPDALSAMPALLRRFDDRDEGLRGYSVSAVSAMGPAIIPALDKLSRDLSPRARWAAVNCLIYYSDQLEEPSQEVIEIIADRLKDDDVSIRRFATRWVRSCKPAIFYNGPLLVELLADEDDIVVGWAANALMRVDQEAIPWFADGLNSADQHQRHQVLQRLGNTKKDLTALAGQLVLLVNEEDQRSRVHVADALGKVSQAKPEVVIALVELLIDEEPDVREAAAMSLAKLAWLPAKYSSDCAVE